MRRLIAIELKLGDFKPADAGQLELYLRWLDRHERQPFEDAPLGIIHHARCSANASTGRSQPRRSGSRSGPIDRGALARRA
jgi:hypothetical protein